MVRNILKRQVDLPPKFSPAPPQPQDEEEGEIPRAKKVPQETRGEDPQVQIVEREITLGLLNDKINYLTGILIKIAEASEIELD